MLKYAKLVNEETKLCEVGLGTNIEFYKAIGMVELDVEQSSLDGNWYLIGYAPQKDKTILIKEKKDERTNIINSYMWRIQRYEQQKTLGIETTDSDKIYLALLSYIQYLRDLPGIKNFLKNKILSFEEWLTKNEKELL